MSFVAVSAGIGAASLGVGLVKGISASNKANAINKSNPRPTYQIPDEYKQNLQLAKQMAQIGLPQQAYNNQANAIKSNQAGAVSALGNSANPGAGLAQIVRAGNNSFGQLNAQDALARQQGTRGVMQANNAIANQKLNQQQYNQFDKYSENFNRAQALEGASNADWQNAFNGAAGLSGALAMNGGFGGGRASVPKVGNSFNDRALNPHLQVQDSMRNFQLGQPPTQLPGNNLNFLPQPNAPVGTGWNVGNFGIGSRNPYYSNPYFPNQ